MSNYNNNNKEFTLIPHKKMFINHMKNESFFCSLILKEAGKRKKRGGEYQGKYLSLSFSIPKKKKKTKKQNKRNELAS